VTPRVVRIGKWVAVACWLLIAIVSVPLSGRLGDAQTNDDTAFLPTTAESTRVIREQQRFPGGQSVPTVLAYTATADSPTATWQRLILLGGGSLPRGW